MGSFTLSWIVSATGSASFSSITENGLIILLEITAFHRLVAFLSCPVKGIVNPNELRV